MNAKSKAYVSTVAGGKTYTYHFTGVTSIEHNLALNLDNTSSQGSDIINGARNLANQVTLSVVETDVEHTSGWAASMLEAMVALKKNRYLCKVSTSMATYKKMLLTEINVTQDEENAYGWSGTLTFMEYIPATSSGSGSSSSGSNKTSNNSSVRKNTGSTGTKKVTGSVFLSLLQGVKSFLS